MISSHAVRSWIDKTIVDEGGAELSSRDHSLLGAFCLFSGLIFTKSIFYFYNFIVY
jgi:hypothetical protein